MKKRITIYAVLVILIACGAYLIAHKSLGAGDPRYEFATITRGDIETTVSSTGILAPVTTVEVGTQVSGIIDSVYVDYNDQVKDGQILAVLDTTLLRSSVLDAEASLERVDAQSLQAQVQYDRYQRLYDSSMVSEEEYLPYEVNLKTQKAAMKSARVALDRACRNLQYAVIRSPINGIVINKNVEAGQTVAASLSTPTLFTIAEDLSRMEILADIDESDIGQIKVEQDVQFEVAAYMKREFKGKVKQVRLQPKTVSNVVTYTAVVEAANEDGLLLPGMTATISFIADKHSGVLLVPSKALRFQPTDEQLAAYQAKHKSQSGNQSDSARTGGRPAFAMGRGEGGDPPGRGGGAMRSMGTVWYVDSLGQLNRAMFRSGLSDKANTEIAASRSITEGMQVIVGLTKDNSKTAATTTTTPTRGFGGPMRGF